MLWPRAMGICFCMLARARSMHAKVYLIAAVSGSLVINEHAQRRCTSDRVLSVRVSHVLDTGSASLVSPWTALIVRSSCSALALHF